MTIATALILNVVAVVGLLVLLAATMRLPYHMATAPRSGAGAQESRRRGRKTTRASRRSKQGRGVAEPVYTR